MPLDDGLSTVGAVDREVQQRVVLRNASLRLVVSDVEVTVSAAMAMAEEMGGWVVESRFSRITLANDEETNQGYISLRVPAERLDEALETLRNQSISVESFSVIGQDVTGEYVDLFSQAENLQAAEIQLQRIMEEAVTTEDVLRVHSELVNVRNEIERIQGRLQYYDQAAAFALISVDLIPEELDRPPTVEIGGWNPVDTLASALQTLVSVLQGIVDIVIWLVVIGVPLVVIVGVSWWLIRRFLRSRGIAFLPSQGSIQRGSAMEEEQP